MKTEYDLIIIGGGMAGLTAGIYGARSNLSTLILEQEVCGGLANWTHTVENFPSYPGISGMDLMEKAREHAEQAGADIIEITQVNRLDVACEPKVLYTDEGEFRARAVIIATGRKPVPLPVETDWQDHIHYCSLCDGILYKNKDIVVVGGGNSAFDESLYLAGLGINSITIVEAMPNCCAAESTIEKVKATGKIEIRTGTKIGDITPRGKTALISLDCLQPPETSRIETDGIFVFIGQKPTTEFLEDMVHLDDQGYILTDADMHTNVPGVFAAGDVIKKKYRQLTTAVSDGTIAALEAGKYLCR